jgi:uncharacterized protein (UPF0210 family)
MQIRSITYFCDPGFPVNQLMLQKAGIFMRHARQAFENAGYIVQTTRLATSPFPNWLDDQNSLLGAQTLQLAAHGEGFDFVSIGPALPGTPDSYSDCIEILKGTSSIFVSGKTTTSEGEVSLAAIHACAHVIHQAANFEETGFTNLRFAALANVPPWAPFFPAAYHSGNGSAFALALEAADLAIDAFSNAQNLASARRSLIDQVEENAQKLEGVGRQLASIYQVVFKGLDFTLSPFPHKDRSIGTALEALGVPAVGLQGTLAAATFITDTLDRASYTRCGFNGLMLPVLEDSVLAIRASEGLLSINDLLLYSTVCGTGLDVIPLPGDTSVAQIEAILLDLSALALRLDKPLTARLMPIPGKKAGDATGFNFEYFANSKVMPLKAVQLTGLLNSRENLPLSPRHKA